MPVTARRPGLVADLLGSVRGTVSTTGALTGATAYDAWGSPETTQGHGKVVF